MGWGLVLGALGAGLGAYNQSRADETQTETLVRGLQDQARRQEEADVLVNDELQRMRGSTPEGEREQAMQGFMDQLRRNRAQSDTSAGPGSSQYLADVGAAERDVEDYATRTADVLARISAPLRQRQREQQGFGRLASGIEGVQRRSAGDEFLTQLRLRGARPNAGLSALSSVLQGAGTGVASLPTSDERGMQRVVRGARRVDAPVQGLSTEGYA